MTATEQNTIEQTVIKQSGIKQNAPAPDTEETRMLREGFGTIAPVTLAYAAFYAFCMYRNSSGVAFPFFVVGSLWFLRFSSARLGISFRKGSGFYMAAMVLLGVSAFCTDDGRIVFFNKLGILLLAMSLLLKQYFDTSGWKLGKYLVSICQLACCSLGELARPIADGALYVKGGKLLGDRRIWYAVLGLLIGAPLLLVMTGLLASADAIFGQMAEQFLEAADLAGLLEILFRIAFLFFASYGLTAYLCRRRIREKVPDRRKGEPVLAITVTGLLTALYLLFSGIQIGGLFLGKLRLPEGCTYAMYAREGFFQLLAVSFLNLVIVLVCMGYFRESRVLKGILTGMSLCTFVMIASSAMRMVLYIHSYSLTFLRILVLWGLGLLAVLFAGVMAGIFRKDFPLFRYSCAAVTVLYLALSFAHPDYIIARVNTANRGARLDCVHLQGLSADAAPVLVPFLEEAGYRMEAFGADSPARYAADAEPSLGWTDLSGPDTFGYRWMERMKERTGGMGLRTFNLSRFLARRLLEYGPSL